MDNDFTQDAQITAIRPAMHYRGDRLIRVATPHRLLDPRNGPLIAVKLHILTRKSLGGIETDLFARALGPDGRPVPGLYAAGEASGLGGGGMHGYRSLKDTFLGGCLFSGRTAGRAATRSWHAWKKRARVLRRARFPTTSRDDPRVAAAQQLHQSG